MSVPTGTTSTDPQRGEPAAVGPEAVLRIASGYRTARVLFTSLELGAFDRLAGGALDPHVLVDRLDVDPIGGRDLVLALLGLGLLERDERGHVRNATATDRFLVREAAEYIGGFLDFLDDVLHPAWDGLTDRLRAGAGRRDAASSTDVFGELCDDSTGRDGFLSAMDVLNAPIAAKLAALDWSNARTVVHVGGARGNVAGTIAAAHPHLSATVFDLPRVGPAFDAHIESLGLTERVRFAPGDVVADPLPRADVVLFGHVLHNWPEGTRVHLLRAAADAVPDGGRVLVYDPILDDAAPGLNTVLASLDMVVRSAGGSEYTVGQLCRWFTEAGLTYAEHRVLAAGSTLVTARKHE